MPEGTNCLSDLEKSLDLSDDYTLTGRNYQAIQNALDKDTNIHLFVVEKLLSVCVRELKEDMKYTSNILNIVSTAIKKVKEAELSPLPDFVPSAVAVLHLLKTTALFNKVEALKTLCFEIILSYPNETLISLVVNQPNELMELFNLYCHQRIPIKIRVQILNIILKLLKILPPEKRAIFVKEGVNIWFSKIIPLISITSVLPQVLEVVEILTDDLVHIDYSDNPQWRVVLENIYTPEKYPSLMKDLLQSNNENWHRIWMIFIKLLKSQITKTNSNAGSPINSMLPVVEIAFKMDVQNRCKAFKCWNVLIDNFATETNEMYINKRIKLLIIPLTSNNAKVEETALAKLNTWWHLINRFYSHMDKIAKIVLIPFLHFCFGKAVNDRPLFIPGMLSEEVKTLCVQAFININGHTDCEGCVNLPKLKGKLLNTTLLVDNWQDWQHFMEIGLKICAENKEFTDKQIKCMWNSFVLTIVEVPNITTIPEMFKNIIELLNRLAEFGNKRLGDITLNILILLLDNMKVRPLLRNNDNSLINNIAQITLKLTGIHGDNRVAANHLKRLSTFFMNESTATNHIIESILKDLPPNGILLWVAFAEAACVPNDDMSQKMLCKLLRWPLQCIEMFANESVATSTWINLYSFAYTKICETFINEDIFKPLISNDSSLKANKFIINALIMATQKKIDSNDGDFGVEAKWLLDTITKINVFEDFEDIHPDVSKIVASMIKYLCTKTNEECAKHVLLIIEHVLKLIKNCTKENVSNNQVTQLEPIFENLKVLLNKNEYSKLAKQFADNNMSLIEYVLNTLNVANEDAYIKEVIQILQTKRDKLLGEESEQNFTTPSVKLVTKKSKKEEANIVSTVVENGEEYVVVKSNWKFNPRKLTDNQKEKMQRKREDIPALYQDLSQSQDEFKLKAWKTDSQDTTTSTSKSNSTPVKEDVKTILKNIPNSEFVPKMLENIIANDKALDSKEKTNADTTKTDCENEVKNELNKLRTVKGPKSPRVALKDRVFKNVKSLMEKSNVNNENSAASSNIPDNVPKTPTSSKLKPSSNVINSAPTLISAERPSRLKRKPKKFEDLQLFGLKRRRHSLGQPDSATDGESSDNNTSDINISEESKKYKTNKIKEVHKATEIKNVAKESSVPDTNETCADISMEPVKTNIVQDNKILDAIGIMPKETREEKSSDKIIEPLMQEQIEIHSESDNKDLSILKSDKNETISESEKRESPTALDLNLSTPNADENLATPKSDKNLPTPKSGKKLAKGPKSSTKKPRKSRIEKELAIDMVEGHPFLNTSQPEKRLTRKAIQNSPNIRKSPTEKNNKQKSESKNTKAEKKLNDKDKSISIKDTQNTSEEILESQDIIESSQDSAITTISVKSNKTTKKVAAPVLEDFNSKSNDTQNLIDDTPHEEDISSKDDVELPRNKTADDKELTEDMDTEPMSSNLEVIDINDEEIQTPNKTQLDEDIQNTAEADTQTLNSQIFVKEIESNHGNDDITKNNPELEDSLNIDNNITNASLSTTADDVTKTMTDSQLAKDSPYKDEEQRKMDFMNNTLEISPIKTLSPVKEKTTPPKQSDYVIIKLSSPVHGNGQPFEKCDSPEIFTEEKSPPRDQSPVREESNANNSSPSSSLSLKKNRPQVRSNGRAAQMLGLCVPDIRMSEEDKKSPSVNSSARRNLRNMYNTNTEQSESAEETEESENFLKLQRVLPPTDCSPSGPILKRKLVDIADEATISPASKRKRVSFHDPPVSTTICVKKYIEPGGVRSPQNSAIKRQERLLRSQPLSKSPKRLENVFKLDSVLTKTVESFSDNNTPDTDMSTSEPTPISEIVTACDLNDTEPLCSNLADCKDPIANIASELSSPTMKMLLVKEFEGKIETVGDLAKLTELEVNRLCIKTPKVQTARRVLDEYLIKKQQSSANDDDVGSKSDEIQADVLVGEMGMQTEEVLIQSNTTQTEPDLTRSSCVQTDTSESSSMADMPNCLSERDDSAEKLCEKIDDASKLRVAGSLSFNDLTKLFLTKSPASNNILHGVIKEHSKCDTKNEDATATKLCIIKNYLCDNFESKDLVLFCSDLLKKVFEKS